MVEKLIKGAEKTLKKGMGEIKKQAVHYGPKAFTAGIILALLMAIVPIQDQLWKNVKLAALIIIGILVGAFNVTENERMLFLLGGLALLVTFNALVQVVEFAFMMNPNIVDMFKAFFLDLSAMLSIAVAVVAVKTVYDVAHDV
ncbi:MAG: hypothetical protein QXF76_02840 [Candidatus Anstonellales archaeon]